MRKIQSGPPMGIVEKRKLRTFSLHQQASTIATIQAAIPGKVIPPIPAPAAADEPDVVEEVVVTKEEPVKKPVAKKKVVTKKKPLAKNK